MNEAIRPPSARDVLNAPSRSSSVRHPSHIGRLEAPDAIAQSTAGSRRHSGRLHLRGREPATFKQRHWQSIPMSFAASGTISAVAQHGEADLDDLALLLDHADWVRFGFGRQAQAGIDAEQAELLDVEDELAGDVAKIAARVAADARRVEGFAGHGCCCRA